MFNVCSVFFNISVPSIVSKHFCGGFLGLSVPPPTMKILVSCRRNCCFRMSNWSCRSTEIGTQRVPFGTHLGRFPGCEPWFSILLGGSVSTLGLRWPRAQWMRYDSYDTLVFHLYFDSLIYSFSSLMCPCSCLGHPLF